MELTRRNLILGAGAGAVAAPGLLSLAGEAETVELNPNRRPSLWSTQALALPTFPVFQGHRTFDVAIIGGGYTGLSCAYYLKRLRPDWDVAVFESHTIGSGASSRNTGALSARHIGVTDPEMPQRGLERLEAFIAREEIECDYGPVNTLFVHATDSVDETNLEKEAEWIAAGDLNRDIASPYYHGATQVPGYYEVDPAKLVAGHAGAANAAGAELFEQSPVLNIERGSSIGLTTPQGQASARQVLIATNAYTPRLGFAGNTMFPLHQYTLATRKLTPNEITHFGLDRWPLRFENRTLPVTFRLTPSGHFFVRMVLGYATYNSCVWRNHESAKQLARTLFEQRYPGISELDLTHGWHGVTGHTVRSKQIFETTNDGTVHISAAYNGLGIMPAHNSGYLMATRIAGEEDTDIQHLAGTSHAPFPGDFYRSLILKPFMNFMTPV